MNYIKGYRLIYDKMEINCISNTKHMLDFVLLVYRTTLLGFNYVSLFFFSQPIFFKMVKLLSVINNGKISITRQRMPKELYRVYFTLKPTKT